ncbi:hypothetical protein CR983_02955 [Candidatus Saccharibacteria bacterium]|nr:MAG: hypothetical protein CR983_02955 [Candidatus Saccharibacteria bacterium]
MYSIGPLPRQKRTGRHVGTHQKIDRIARRHLRTLVRDDSIFPTAKEIIHFEGMRGPDGIKLKSPGVDEPVHFIDPVTLDGPLLDYISEHSHNLSRALHDGDRVRAAFEAAWLAHAVTDGLTPAHHEPYEEQLRSLRKDSEPAKKLRAKMLIRGQSRRETLRNNWKYWGAHGIMTTHTLFEAGVVTASKSYDFDSACPAQADIDAVRRDGFEATYIRLIKEVATLDMYETFKRTGWTRRLAKQTNKELLPRIIIAVTLAWYAAIPESESDR